MNKKRFSLLFVVFFLCLPVLFFGGHSKQKHFHVVASEFEPFVFQKENKVVGLDIDILDMALKAKGCTYEIELVPFSSLFEKVEKGEADIAIGALYYTPDRADKLIPSKPYFKTGLVIVSPSARPLNYEKELNNKKIGVKAGATGEDCVKKLLAKGYRVVLIPYSTTEESFSALKSGQIDAVLNDYVDSLFLIQEKYPGEMVVSEDFFGPNLIDKNELVFYFGSTLGEEVKDFDDGVKSLEKAHILENLRKKWVPGIKVEKGGLGVRFLYMIAILFLLIVFIIFIQKGNEKKRALKISERRYRELLTYSPIAVILHKEGKLLFANKAVYTIFGRKEGELPEGFPVIRLFAEGEHPKLNEFLRKRGEGKEAPEAYETYGLRADGTAFPLDVSVAVIDSSQGKTTIVLLKDITEKKRMIVDLEKSEERYRHIFEEIDYGIYVSTKAGKPLVSNPAIIKMLGYDSFEDISKRDIEKEGYPDPSERRRFQEIMEREGKVVNFETIWIKKDGTPINVIESSNPIRDEAGNIIAYEGIVKDITEKKKAEEALKQSERYYKNLFEAAHDAIMVFDPVGAETILDVNDQCLRLYGFKREEMIGMSLEKFSKHVSKGKERLDEVSRRGQLKNFETVHFKKDGSEMILEINASMIDYQGKPAILSINRDITEKKQVEKALLEKNRQLVALFWSAEAMGSFTDLKTSAYALCHAAVDSFSFKMAWLGLVVPETTLVQVIASAGHDEGYTDSVNVRWDESSSARGPGGRSIVTRGPVIMKVTDPDFAPWREEAEKRGFKICCSFPLIHEDTVRGALLLYSEDLDAFAPNRLETLNIFVRHATMAVVTASLYEEANKTINELLVLTGEKEQIAQELRIRAEELSKSEEKFKSIVEQARAILLIWDTQGKVTYWNEYAEAFFGFKRNEILGRSLFDTIVPATESTGRDLIALLMEIGKDANKFASNINENITKDGKRVWIAWTNRPILDKEGNIEEVLSVGTDITHLKVYETAIINWEKVFSEMIQGGCGFVYRRSTELALTIAGVYPGRDEELKRKWAKVLNQLDREPGRTEFFSGILKSSQPAFREISVEFEDGDIWTVRDAAQCLKDNRGEARYITGLCIRAT
jgi:PAS domain S-box-containing protein